MLVYGEIVSLNGHYAKVKVNYKNFQETEWYFIPQISTQAYKSSILYEIGTEVAAMKSEYYNNGCIIGAIYNKKDTSPTNDKNIKTVVFSDGSVVEYNKQNHTFKLDIKGNAVVKANKVNIDGDLEVSGNVSDRKGSMQEIRDKYNSHTHGNGNNGANTSSPYENM